VRSDVVDGWLLSSIKAERQSGDCVCVRVDYPSKEERQGGGKRVGEANNESSDN
jgi:hypothetical protein